MKIDFHIHTCYSYDSLMKPGKILNIAKKRGLDGIVVCDHNTIKGGLEAQRLNRDRRFHVIVGAEIATNAGDITGLFLTKEIESRDIDGVIREIREQNGKVVLNHPFYHHDLSKIDLSNIDFIEGYNSRLNNEDNQKAVDLANINNIPVIAGSDAHLYDEIGNGITTVKDIETLAPLAHEYKQTPLRFITLSQYVKAVKKRETNIFISATIIQAKHSFRQCIKVIKTAFMRNP